MSMLGRALLVCGAVVAVTAATIGTAFFGMSSWLTWVPLAAGIGSLLLGALVAVRRTALRRGAGMARARLALECVLVLLAAGAVNVVVVRFPASIDVTASKRNTLAEASVQVARALRVPVTIRASLPTDDRSWRELVELVERYRRDVSFPGALTLERSPPDDAAATGAASRDSDARILVIAGDRRLRVRFEAGAPDQEAALTRALRTVAVDARVRAYVLAGHGEASVAEDGSSGLRRFAQALVDEGLDVVPLPLATVGVVPDDAALVVVAGARDIPASSVALLTRWFEAGGRLLVLLEPGQPSGLESLLGAVGIQVNDDVIRDTSAFAGILGGPETATGVAYASHPITSKLGGAMTHFPRARSLSVNPGTPGAPVALVQTGADAYGETTPGSVAFEPGDVEGPLTLALAAALPTEQGKGGGRVVVVGDASFVSNQALGLGANQDLALNAALWLLARDEEIVVRPRGRGGNLLLLSPTARERIAFVLLYGLPVALLCVGFTVSAVRRRR